MMKSTLVFTLAGSLLVFTGGCAQDAQRIDQTQRITTVHQIDVQDWEEAADELLHSLLTRGPLQGSDSSSIIAISRIVNDTSQRINTAHLTDYILTELNRSGRAQASMVAGIGGPEDPLIYEQRRAEEFIGERRAQVREFDYTLNGRIIEERRRAGRVSQSTFIFTLRLADTRTGTAIWQERKVIDKAGTRPAVGM